MLHSFFNLFFVERNEMHRGCESDKTDDRSTCSEVNQRCVLCNGSACNSSPATTQSSLSCIQCSNTDAACAWGHTSNNSANCAPIVVFPNVESCYTFTHDSSTVTRGCTLDNQLLCTAGDQRCNTCTGVGCNVQNIVTQSCKVCRSDQSGQDRCGEEGFEGFEQQCGTIVTYEKRGCYTKKEGMAFSVFSL